MGLRACTGRPRGRLVTPGKARGLKKNVLVFCLMVKICSRRALWAMECNGREKATQAQPLAILRLHPGSRLPTSVQAVPWHLEERSAQGAKALFPLTPDPDPAVSVVSPKAGPRRPLLTPDPIPVTTPG